MDSQLYTSGVWRIASLSTIPFTPFATTASVPRAAFCRNIETVDNDMVNSPNHRKGLVVPFEARGVDEVMRTWNGSPKRANGKESSQMSNVLSATGDSSNELSTEAQLEKMRPKDVISWVEFRVRLLQVAILILCLCGLSQSCSISSCCIVNVGQYVAVFKINLVERIFMLLLSGQNRMFVHIFRSISRLSGKLVDG